VLPGEIGVMMGISSARVSAALTALENKGLITRKMDSDDRRKIIVDLTEAGLERARKHRKTALDSATRILETLGERDAKEFVRILGRVAGAAAETCDTG
jgi:DNA-binding MarR family transcriptional regulator